MIAAKLLLYSAIAFFFFGALAFLALITVVIRNWRAEKKDDARRFDVLPVTKLGGKQ